MSAETIPSQEAQTLDPLVGLQNIETLIERPPPSSFAQDHVGTQQEAFAPRFDHRYTPTAPSPLSLSQTSIDLDRTIYSGEPVLAYPSHREVFNRPRSQSGSVTVHSDAHGSVDSRRDRRRTVGDQQRRNYRNFVDKVDKLDLSNIYGGTTYHHESPYDCVLPHRNVNEQAPVLAFQHSEEKNYSSSKLPFRDSQLFEQQNSEGEDEYHRPPKSRYSLYDSNGGFNYMDSFLEGSTAYGVQTESQEQQPKRRPSLLKRISQRRKTKSNNGAIITSEDSEEEDEEPICPQIKTHRSNRSLEAILAFLPGKKGKDRGSRAIGSNRKTTFEVVQPSNSQQRDSYYDPQRSTSDKKPFTLPEPINEQ